MSDKLQQVTSNAQEKTKNNTGVKDIPYPDILIRTGGEKRISNYLLWQIAYSEVIVVDEYWPEFDRCSLLKCIEEFNRRQRRYGK